MKIISAIQPRPGTAFHTKRVSEVRETLLFHNCNVENPNTPFLSLTTEVMGEAR